METLIGVKVFLPRKKSEKCYALKYSCTSESCPFLARGECIQVMMFEHCVYSWVDRVNGWTPRAKAYNSFLEDWRKEAKKYSIKAPSYKGVERVGDYYWLPYSHMDHVDGERQGIPFEAYSGFMQAGSPFMPAERFTPEMVVKLVEFRPTALLDGRAIPAYYEESVPRFLNDLRTAFPDIYAKALELKPEIAEIANKNCAIAVKLSWLTRRDLSLDCWIRGVKARVYGSLNSVRFEECDELVSDVVQSPLFTQGESQDFFIVDPLGFLEGATNVEIHCKLPGDTLVWLDEHRTGRFMRIRQLAERKGAVERYEHNE